MNSSTATSSSPQLPDEYNSDFLRDKEPYNRLQKDNESKYLSAGGNTTKEEILKLSRQRVPRIWWFPTISLKLGNTRFVVPCGKMVMASLLLLMYYLTRKKQAALKRVLAKKAVSMKKALVDLWQLAFSYQVNPLAAVQTLPTSTRGSY
ncbi:hypothetical protein BUALT_Bualt11G0075000 [Buddleja alternifolia]|uniref:Uncharacterized protein n=1 Tax=Buddleja alternifolia TaxID=168488 RepID=A0AAV6WS97_9LAMI|nr:hypothetical protein BUALT_Bualt11G0075000 [Buddleja alternifolia]